MTPFGPKATATLAAGDLLMIVRGSGLAMEIEKVDPAAGSTAALIAAGIDAWLGSSAWRSGGGGAGGGGNVVLSGAGAPAAGTGIDGDFWIDTTSWAIYGPKSAGAWGAGISLVGPAGDDGPPGDAGAPGADGRSVLNGAGAPAAGTGTDGDFWIDTDAWVIFGPKAAGAWPAGVPLKPRVEVVTALPASPDPGTFYVIAAS
jgi:hypothetical protein